MFEQIKLIQATLTRTAEGATTTIEKPVGIVDEDVPLFPYEQKKNKPTDLDYKDLSLKAPRNLNVYKKPIESLNAVNSVLADAEGKLSTMQKEYTENVAKIKNEMGYEDLKREQTEVANQLAEAIQREFLQTAESLGQAKHLLIEVNNTVYTVYNHLEEGTVDAKEKLENITNVLNKLLSPEMVSAITKAADDSLAQIIKAKTDIKRRFVSFKAAKDLRKQVKEELPKEASVRTAGIFETIKRWVSSFVSTVKDIFSPVEESVAELQATLEQTEPLVDELNALMADGVTAGKKTAGNQYRDWLEHNVGDVQEAMEVVDALAGHLEFMSDTDSRALPLANKLWAAL